MASPIDGLTVALAARYRIEREIGGGGMATVYLAEDLKHHRHVALKVLRPELAAVLGADRFVQEIETTANLQHPHILPLFDSGEVGGFLYYVMPFIDGETLRDKLNREKQLGIDEAVKIAMEVADALDYAHRHDVIHRDVKPENILLHDGRPVVADFGIALAVSAAASGRFTETGLSLGTPHYMSPEQATAEKDITHRSDIYSLGCVLYEMLTGNPPHVGSTAQQIIMKIVTDDVASVRELRKSVPSNVAAAIRKALERLPADRFAQASEMIHALQDPAFHHGEDPKTVTASDSRRWKLLAIGASALSVAALFVAGFSLVAGNDQAHPVSRWQIAPLGEGIARPVGYTFALAPDGSSMVFGETVEGGTDWQLWLKPRAEATATPLPGTARAQSVTYSPDGQHIAFVAGTEIKRRPIGDGSTITLARGARPGTVGLAWLSNGTILYEGAGSAVVRIPETGGALTDTITTLPEIFNIAFIGELPDSRGALIALCIIGCYVSTELWVMDFQADTTRFLIDEVLKAWYVSSGHLVYVSRGGGVFAAPFNLDALEITGPGMLLLEGVEVNGPTPEMVMGRDGTVIYATGAAMGAIGTPEQLVWVDRSGGVEVVDATWTADLTGLSLSPAGDRVAVVRREPDGSEHIWIKPLDGSAPHRLTFDGQHNVHPAWMPDGQSIVFASDRAGGIDIFEKSADGSRNAEILVDGEDDVHQPVISADSEWLIYTQGTDLNADVMAKPLRRDGDPVGIADSAGLAERQPALSPNGRWLAYVSGQAGAGNVYDVWVLAFPEGESRWQVSYDEFGGAPKWSHNGSELFYRSGAAAWEMASVEVFATSTFVRGPATVLFQWRDLRLGSWDVGPDDQRFIFTQDVSSRNLVVVENFFEVLREKLRQ